MDTIFALATARGKAGISVVRLSGPRAHDAVGTLAGDLPPVRQTALRTLRFEDEILDRALVVVFASGASFTGESSAEIHLHGSIAVVSAVLRALGTMEGLRHAEPGEFTRRALDNGQLDLPQVEGLADLIDAETEAQRRQALRVLSGAVGERAEGWRQLLLRAAALVEATIDFADEDVPVDVKPDVVALLDKLLDELRREVKGAAIAERVRDGFEVAIVGRPNSGKSTLLNYLAGRNAAITSSIPGTTRDVIEVRMDLDGLPVTLLDTAGLRETDDPVEGMGIAQTRSRAGRADLRVFLLDEAGIPEGAHLNDDDILAWSKADLGCSGFGVSGATGAGVAELTERIVKALAGRMAATGSLTRERHRIAVLRAIEALESARSELSTGRPREELVAERIRGAIRSLDALVGRIDVESLLGEIFARFCIGK